MVSSTMLYNLIERAKILKEKEVVEEMIIEVDKIKSLDKVVEIKTKLMNKLDELNSKIEVE